MINSLARTRFMPTVFYVPNSIQKAIKNPANKDLKLAIEALQNQLIRETPKKRSLKQVVLDMIKPGTQLFVNIGIKDNNKLTLTTIRKINEIILFGKEVPLNIAKLATDKNEVVRILNESKQGMLETISRIKKGI